MLEQNNLNIPAYQRKRSIMAKAKKKANYLQPEMPKPAKSSKKTRAKKAPKITPGKAYTFQEAIDEFSIKQSMPPSQDIFPNPFFGSNSESQKPQTLREWKACGICEGYFDKIDVAIVKVTSAIRNGDILIFEKQDGLFEQEIKSMQIDRRDINLATTGSEIGLKIDAKPTVGSAVYKLI